MPSVCDWCGAPGEVIAQYDVWDIPVNVLHCTTCHHEWEEVADAL